MKVGILGAGSIARVLARTMVKMEEVELYAVGARDFDRAKAFAKEFNIEKAYGSYEELVSDEQVGLIYVATPHSHHAEHMRLCIEHGKPVLCEKSFTTNAKEAREVFDLAKEKGVYVAEAIWTRYMPSRAMINEIVASGIVGDISMVTSNLCYDIDGNERIVQPSLSGGALLDVGVYGINFMLMHVPSEIDHIETSVQMTDTGVDGRESITIFLKNETMGVTTHGIYGRSDRKGIFYGERGYIIVENINNPNQINVYDGEDNLIKHIDVPEQITGYEYEVRESIKQIEAGKIESDSMPWAESIHVLEIMDGIRTQWGLKYPQED